MIHVRFRAVALIATLAIAACSGGGMNRPGGSYLPATSPYDVHIGGATIRPLCGPVARPEMRCFSWIRMDRIVHDTTSNSIPYNAGYTPQNIWSAYDLSSAAAKGGKGQVVAIVDAYGYPTAASDLAHYRAAAGLPKCAYGRAATSCFRIVNESGSPTGLPGIGKDWRGEQSLDLDAVSGICPNCKIILVQVRSDFDSDLYTGTATAGKLGATVISNSFGGPEGGAASDSAYDQPGRVIVVSAGDNGGGASFDGYDNGPQMPCTYATVVCAGGTELVPSGASWKETVWNDIASNECSGSCGGTGSGCSTIVPKPSWQSAAACPKRAATDVSASASPLHGYAVYNTIFGGWAPIGGTSLSAPLIAAVYAIAGNAHAQNGAANLWAHHTKLHDVTKGNNLYAPLTGPCASSIHQVCYAGPGYDGPTGWGSPNGITDF